MRPGETITNQYGTFEAVKAKSCKDCAAHENIELCNIINKRHVMCEYPAHPNFVVFKKVTDNEKPNMP